MAGFDFCKIFKILCIALCAMFLLTACSGNGRLCSNEEETKASAQAAGKNCWQKSMLETFYKTTGEAANKTYDKLISENLIMTIMVLAFTIWLAFQVLGHVSSATPESIGEFWTKVLRKAALCFICGTLASSKDGLYYTLNTFIFPIYTTILEFASEIMSHVEKGGSGMSLGSGDFEVCEIYQNSPSGCSLAKTNVSVSGGSFPEAPKNLMGCMACYVSDRLNTGYSIAMMLICIGEFIPTIIAIVLVAVFTITKLGFALYLVDSIFRMNMMIIILPFLIMFYAFEQTRKWSKVGFQFILNSSAIMLCLVLVLATTVMAMENALGSNNVITFDKEAFTSLGPSPMAVMFLAFVILKASSMSVSLSDSITGGSGSTNFQKKVKAVVGTIAKLALVLLTAGAGKVVTTVIEHSERARMMAEKARKARMAYNRATASMRRLAGRNNNQDEEQS